MTIHPEHPVDIFDLVSRPTTESYERKANSVYMETTYKAELSQLRIIKGKVWMKT